MFWPMPANTFPKLVTRVQHRPKSAPTCPNLIAVGRSSVEFGPNVTEFEPSLADVGRVGRFRHRLRPLARHKYYHDGREDCSCCHESCQKSYEHPPSNTGPRHRVTPGKQTKQNQVQTKSKSSHTRPHSATYTKARTDRPQSCERYISDA